MNSINEYADDSFWNEPIYVSFIMISIYLDLLSPIETVAVFFSFSANGKT